MAALRYSRQQEFRAPQSIGLGGFVVCQLLFATASYNSRMLDGRLLLVFLATATLLAITPGPGIFYVLTRTHSITTRSVEASAQPSTRICALENWI
jgi:hypothetical protein